MLTLKEHNANARITEGIPESVRVGLLSLLKKLEKDDCDPRVLMSDKSHVDYTYYSENTFNGSIAIKTSLKDSKLRLLFRIAGVIIDRACIDFFNQTDAKTITYVMHENSFIDLDAKYNQPQLMTKNTVVVQPDAVELYEKLMTYDYDSWVQVARKDGIFYDIKTYQFPRAIGSVYEISDLIKYLNVSNTFASGIIRTLSMLMYIMKRTDLDVKQYYTTVLLPSLEMFCQRINNKSSKEEIINAIAWIYAIDIDDAIYALLASPETLAQMLE